MGFSLITSPFIAILDKIGLPTDVKEIKPGSKDSFDGAVRDLNKELEQSTATVTVSAANPLIALAPRPSAGTMKKTKKTGRKKK